MKPIRKGIFTLAALLGGACISSATVTPYAWYHAGENGFTFDSAPGDPSNAHAINKQFGHGSVVFVYLAPIGAGGPLGPSGYVSTESTLFGNGHTDAYRQRRLRCHQQDGPASGHGQRQQPLRRRVSGAHVQNRQLRHHGGQRHTLLLRRFRSERLRVFMEAWLAAHAFKPVPRPAYTPEAPAAKASPSPSPIVQDSLAARRSRGSEALRKQLRDVAESLGGRDLEKVIVFAEFVKARRAARTAVLRPENGPESEEELAASASRTENEDDLAEG